MTIEDELREALALKDEFLATLSHELRTPLNAVLGWAELLLSRAPADGELRRGLETIARNARIQAQLIEDLLDMNRIVSGKVRLEISELDPEATIRAAIDSLRSAAAHKGVEIREHLEPIGEVSGDRKRLQQVVWNLVSNAVKFTPRGGRVEIALRRERDRLHIVVADTGAGIAREFVGHVFDHFRQADGSSTRRHGGLGLGLAIVKQLVELHGGTINADSEGEGRGAKFTVSLPMRAAIAPPEPPPPSQPPAVTLTGVKVLVIDDEADARALLELVLSDAGAEVFSAATGDEALALLAQRQPDVIVSDIGMPDRDGYQLMRSIRNLPPERGGRTPAVALTAFARSEDRTRALLAGYQVHITKPLEPIELVVTLASLTGRT